MDINLLDKITYSIHDHENYLSVSAEKRTALLLDRADVERLEPFPEVSMIARSKTGSKTDPGIGQNRPRNAARHVRRGSPALSKRCCKLRWCRSRSRFELALVHAPLGIQGEFAHLELARRLAIPIRIGAFRRFREDGIADSRYRPG